MIGDVIDESALRTGRRAEGLFYAANSFMQKCVTGFGLMAAGILLTVVNLPERARPEDVDPASVDLLVLLYLPSVALLYLAGAVFLRFYRIDRASPRGQSRGIAGPGGGRGYGWRSGLGIPVHAGSPRWRIVSQQPVSRCQPERAAL